MTEADEAALYDAMVAKDLDAMQRLVESGVRVTEPCPSGLGWASQALVTAGSWYAVWLTWKAGAERRGMPIVQNRFDDFEAGEVPERPAPRPPAPKAQFSTSVGPTFRLQDLPVESVSLTLGEDDVCGMLRFAPGTIDGALTTLRLEFEDLPLDLSEWNAAGSATSEEDDGLSGGDSGYEGSICVSSAHVPCDLRKLVLTRTPEGEVHADLTFEVVFSYEGVEAPDQTFRYAGPVAMG